MFLSRDDKAAELAAARNECRAVLLADSGVCSAALMRELGRSAIRMP